MSKKPEISVIIPVYNAEKSIRECIETIERQTIERKEIICIDDGSSDNSLKIIENLAKKYGNIVYCHQDNAGAGSARNRGLELYSGEYVIFIDADDIYLEDDALRRMIDKCKKNDVHACGSIMTLFVDGKVFDNFDEIKPLLGLERIQYRDYPIDYNFTTFVFESKIIKENNIRFPNLKTFEDPPFFVQVLNLMGAYVYEDVRLYGYRLREAQRSISADKVFHLLEGLKMNIKYTIHHNIPQLCNMTLNRLEREYFQNIYLNAKGNEDEIRNRIAEIYDEIDKSEIKIDNNYRFLKYVKEGFFYSEEEYSNYLKKRINHAQNVFFYGMGNVARAVFRFAEVNDIAENIKGFVVTEKEERREYRGKHVYSLEEYQKIDNKGLLLLTVSEKFAFEIEEELIDKKISNYIFFNKIYISVFLSKYL